MERLNHGEALGIRGRFARWFAQTDFVLVALVALTLTVFFSAYKMTRIDAWMGDTAMYFQATENVAQRGLPVSQVQGAIVDYMYVNDFLSKRADRIAESPGSLFSEPARFAEYSLLSGHAYFVLYPIAVLVKFFPVSAVLLSLFVLTFFGTALLLYFALRRESVSITAAFLFCLLAICHPAWWESLIGGQFYPDRFFIFAGLTTMLLANNRDDRRSFGVPNSAWLGLAAAATASINERGAIVAGIFLLCHVVLYWSRTGINRPFRIIVGGVLLGYGYFVLKVMLGNNPEYGGFFPKSLDALVAQVSQPSFAHLVTLFLLVNLPFFVLTAFEWRAAVIAVVLILPNIFGNIGGAEKIGWTTHYPSFFLPSLLWAALLGYAALFKKARGMRLERAASAAAAALIAYLFFLNPNSPDPIDFGFANLAKSAPIQMETAIDTYVIDPKTRRSLQSAAEGIRNAVPQNSVVSSVESGMALLYPGRSIQYFPKDIDAADYAVLGASVVNGTITYNGVLDYAGPEEQRKLTDLTLKRMLQDGYDFAHPKFFPAFDGLVVVKRRH